MILLAKDLDGLKNLLNSLLIAILALALADKRRINVVEMKLIKAENLTLKLIVIVKNRKRLTNRLNKAVIDYGSNLVTEGGRLKRGLEARDLCKGLSRPSVGSYDDG